MASKAEVLLQIPFEILIPMWQMSLYVLIASACMLAERHKLALIATYLFTLYWSFVAYFGQIFLTSGTWPSVATLFLLCGSLHVALTLVAFFQEDSRAVLART